MAHRCPITEGAGGLIDPGWCTVAFAPVLRALPENLSMADATRPELKLYSDDRISVYFAPMDLMEPAAPVLLVGITPGRAQLHLAVTTAAAALREGRSVDTAVGAAKRTARFAGPMRTHLTTMLDGIGLHHALGLATSAHLFADRADLLASTSAICHSVIVPDGNYSGDSPRIDRHPVLRAFARQVLAVALEGMPDALVIPFGERVQDAVELSGIDPKRVLWGFPHPSGGNGYRVRYYNEARDDMARIVAA
jgi:hypothetical protein